MQSSSVTNSGAAAQPAEAGAGFALSRRLEVVDVIRGFALMALFLVHVMESYELYWTAPDGGPIVDTVFLLFMGKSFSVLALCFGFSFFILMDRAAQRGTDFSRRFAWRLLILAAIGFVHSVIYRGDIIQILAAIGFVLLLAHRVRSNRVLVAVAIFLFLGPTLWFQLVAAAYGAAWANQPPNAYVDPAMQAYLHGSLADVLHMNLWVGQQPKWWFMIESGRMLQILGLYLVGMVLGRIGFFARPAAFVRVRWAGLAVAAAMAAVLYVAKDAGAARFATLQLGAAPDRLMATILGSWFELSGTAFWVLLLVNLFQSPVVSRLLLPLAAAGRATLTLYILQSVVFVPVFYGYGLALWDDWNPAVRLGVGLAGIAAQLLAARLWFAHFQYGPIEWVWRALTYMRSDVPFRRRRPAPVLQAA